MNICVKCRYHFASIEPSGRWYDHYCHHPDLERDQTIDPVTGDPCYLTQNDLGRTHTTDEKHPHCRSINTDGRCGLYEPKG